MKFLDEFEYPNLIFLAIVLAILPIMPEPHLVQKYRMFMAGELKKPIDIIDVLFHSSGLIILTLKFLADLKRGKLKKD